MHSLEPITMPAVVPTIQNMVLLGTGTQQQMLVTADTIAEVAAQTA